MSLRMHQRIDRLEGELRQRGCPTCKGFPWDSGIVFLVKGNIVGPNGELSDDAELDRPEYCPECGAHHPIHTVIDLGGAGWEAI